MDDIKQVIIIRRDLKMRRGKEIAQGAHASNGFLVDLISDPSYKLEDVARVWLERGSKKNCLKVNSEEELLETHKKAREAGLPSFLIQDSGKTEFQNIPTYTACAIGPEESSKIDLITSSLALY